MSPYVVTVHWCDGYLEEFHCLDVRFGVDLLWMRLMDGANRHLPLRHVRWFSLYPESPEDQSLYQRVQMGVEEG